MEHGLLDCGLSGHDWVVESGADVVEVCELQYSRASNQRSRWVLAVPEDSPVQSVVDLSGKRVATELIEVTRAFFDAKGVRAKVEFSWGATEAKVPELADAIVDLTETGSSLRANKLRIVDTVFETSIRLIANKKSWEDAGKREKIEQMALLLQASLQAQSKVGLKLNLPRNQLDTVLQVVPALRNPTISPLGDPDWVALESIVDESTVREMIPRLKVLGGEGIIEYPLNKVIL
ncbi:MAG: ATP phosphoribosyltransferase [Opitutales bacterium]